MGKEKVFITVSLFWILIVIISSFTEVPLTSESGLVQIDSYSEVNPDEKNWFTPLDTFYAMASFQLTNVPDVIAIFISIMFWSTIFIVIAVIRGF